MSEFRMRSLRPDPMVHDRDGAHWRGAVINSIVGGTITVSMLAEAHMVRTKTCSTALVPADAQVIGCPIACRVTGTGADDYTIAEVVGSYARPGSPYGVIPRSITGEPETWWEE
jgi:hypothetical protein